MNYLVIFLFVYALGTSTALNSANFKPLTAQQFTSQTGFKAQYEKKEKMYRVEFPRTDLQVTVDHVPLDPFMGLTSWFLFSQTKENEFSLSGELVLTQDEVDSALGVLIDNGFTPRSLDRHFFYDDPPIYFLRLVGAGSLESLSNTIKKVLQTIQTIRLSRPKAATDFVDTFLSSSNSVSITTVDQIFGIKGQSKEGIIKYIIEPKAAPNKEEESGNKTSEKSWMVFTGSDSNALVNGALVVNEKAIKQTIATLRKANIHVVGLARADSSPNQFIIHFWGKGKAEKLAEALQKLFN